MKNLSNKVVKELIKKKIKVSFAESCTGGMLSSSITSVSGSSKIFNLGLITYSNKAKINFLDNFANVKILDKETGISPGQACVFYSKDELGDKVLGGGWIHKTHNKNLST